MGQEGCGTCEDALAGNTNRLNGVQNPFGVGPAFALYSRGTGGWQVDGIV